LFQIIPLRLGQFVSQYTVFFQEAFKVDAGCIFRIEAETSNELAVSVHKLLSAWKIITDYSLTYCPVLCRKKRKYSTAQCGTNPWPDFGLKWEITTVTEMVIDRASRMALRLSEFDQQSMLSCRFIMIR